MIRVLIEVWPECCGDPFDGWSEKAVEGIEALLRGVGVLCGGCVGAQAFVGVDVGGGEYVVCSRAVSGVSGEGVMNSHASGGCI